jgi:septal ring factor EnvC (AmiA/AmiB activator)
MVPSTISSGAPSRPGRQSLEDALAAKATVEAEFARAREEFAHTKAEANDEIERLQAHIEEFARTTAEANAEIERLQAHIADIHHSTSWRVTSLVRSLGEIRNRVFGRSGT